eukprot:3848313-Amphidinium_carterae.2
MPCQVRAAERKLHKRLGANSALLLVSCWLPRLVWDVCYPLRGEVSWGHSSTWPRAQAPLPLHVNEQVLARDRGFFSFPAGST